MEKVIPRVNVIFKGMYFNAGKEGVFTFNIPFNLWVKYMCEDFIKEPLKIIRK